MLLTEEEDDLEFTVSFPSPSLPSSLVEEEEEVVEPVVFLLGWEGSKDEELVVYSRLYESLGCITVRYSSQARFLYTATSETSNITTRQGPSNIKE